MAQPNLFLLAADNSTSLLPLLRADPSLASTQDAHGYSLLHAAASYHHLDLLRTLVDELHADVNIEDEDGETPLFVVETVEAAQCLVEELHADTTVRNAEDLMAEEKIEGEGEFPTVAAYLRETRTRNTSSANGVRITAQPSTEAAANGVHPPPPLPPNVTVNVGTMAEQTPDGGEVDPDFRRRIEELASREDFQGEEGQRELRELITDAVRGVSSESHERDVRQRLS
ncbi:MAG: hypothetical protein M1830_006891 [Pleopsidium flavum]|nr:MAG: hypothetical protein M1830_006891 [Pleopsidium flavum]